MATTTPVFTAGGLASGPRHQQHRRQARRSGDAADHEKQALQAAMTVQISSIGDLSSKIKALAASASTLGSGVASQLDRDNAPGGLRGGRHGRPARPLLHHGHRHRHERQGAVHERSTSANSTPWPAAALDHPRQGNGLLHPASRPTATSAASPSRSTSSGAPVRAVGDHRRHEVLSRVDEPRHRQAHRQRRRRRPHHRQRLHGARPARHAERDERLGHGRRSARREPVEPDRRRPSRASPSTSWPSRPAAGDLVVSADTSKGKANLQGFVDCLQRHHRPALQQLAASRSQEPRPRPGARWTARWLLGLRAQAPEPDVGPGGGQRRPPHAGRHRREDCRTTGR